jgi:hypothetical protein
MFLVTLPLIYPSAMLRRFRRTEPPELTRINYTPEHVALAKTIARRRRIVAAVARSIPLIRWVGFLNRRLLIPGCSW